MNIKTSKASYIAKGGLFTAICFICIYLSTIVPVNKAYLLAIASCIIPLSVITTSIKNTIIVYTATSLLSLLILGVKAATISYISFFGLYGLIKYYIETLRRLYFEFILKFLFFNVNLVILFLTYRLFLPNLSKINMPIYILIIAAQIAFLIFDYILTMFISYSNKYFIKRYKL